MLINENIFPGKGFADPHAVVVGERVYLFCGRDRSARAEDRCRMHKWTVISTDDLVNYKEETDILPQNTYIGDQDHCFAGDIAEKDGKYYWYFSNLNIDIGVMVAESPTGPFVDALNKPLIPEHAVPTHCYDPAVFCEDGVYSIFFGAGKYYVYTLGEDMISTVGEPRAIEIVDKDGNSVPMGDKSSVFKHGDKYYIACGNRYSMSNNLFGPYLYMGEFVAGGHNDVFEFKGRKYLAAEFHDTSVFFRAIRVCELDFNEDGTVIIPADNQIMWAGGRDWDFSQYDMHWYLSNGEDCDYRDNAVHYHVDSNVALRSPIFPGIQMNPGEKYGITLDITNNSSADSIVVEILTRTHTKVFWKTPEHDTQREKLQITTGDNKLHFVIDKAEDIVTHIKLVKLFSENTADSGTIVVRRIKIAQE